MSPPGESQASFSVLQTCSIIQLYLFIQLNIHILQKNLKTGYKQDWLQKNLASLAHKWLYRMLETRIYYT